MVREDPVKEFLESRGCPEHVVQGGLELGEFPNLRTAVEAESSEDVRCLCVNNPALTRAEFIELLAKGFELSADAARSKACLLIELEAKLVNKEPDRRVVLADHDGNKAQMHRASITVPWPRRLRSALRGFPLRALPSLGAR